jgi:hypothetical protein
MNKITFTLSCLALATISFNAYSNNTKTKSLADILADYAVPKFGMCDSELRGIYDVSKNAVRCDVCNTFYERSSRQCQYCPDGSYVSDKYSQECIKISCGVGEYGTVVKGDNLQCPVGTYSSLVYSCDS